MRKIYTGMYLYIYVNILRYVKRATSKVTLCSHEFYCQGYFSIDISIFLLSKDVYLQFFFALAKQEETASRSSSGTNIGTIP